MGVSPCLIEEELAILEMEEKLFEGAGLKLMLRVQEMLGAFVFDIADVQVLDDVVGAVAIMGVKVNDSNRL